MKISKKWITMICACMMGLSVTAGIVNVNNVATAQAEINAQQTKNEAFKDKVKKYSTYSGDVLDTYMMPIWNTDEVVDESATVVTETGKTSLLYIPLEGSVIIRDYHNEKYYVEGVDFTVDYKTGELIRIASGELPYFALNEYIGTTAPVGGGFAGLDATEASAQNDKDTQNAQGSLLLYRDKLYLENHFNVSYRVNTALTGNETGVRKDKIGWEADFKAGHRVTDITKPTVVSSKADTYVNFLNKLKLDNEATIMFYGDSITYGCNATGFANGGGNYNPYLPRWSELVTDWLSREYGADITYLNGAVGGWTTADGVNYWQEAHPTSEMGQHGMIPADYAGDADLLVLAFGMNDATGSEVSQSAYSNNLSALIDKYYEARGDKGGAVLLVSNMMPNTQSTWYDNSGRWHKEVENTLYALADRHIAKGRSVAVAPVGGVFKTFEEKGKFTRNVLSNNMNHPTDFAIRVYAQTVLQTLTGYADDSVKDGDTVIGNNNIIIGKGASVRLGLTEAEGDTTLYSGIRFRAYVNEKFFDDIGGNPEDKEDVVLNSRYKAGMWIIPRNILEDTGLELNNYTNENVQKYLFNQDASNKDKTFTYNPNVKYVYNIDADIWDDCADEEQMDGYVRFNAAFLKIPNTEFARDLVARAYIYDTQTGKYYVSRGWQCRNIAQVSSKVLLTDTNLTPSQIGLLEWFVEGGVGESGLPATFLYNGVKKSLQYPNTTYQCACGKTGITATQLIGDKYCPYCSPAVDKSVTVKWCSACNKVNVNCNHAKSWDISTYHHDKCGKYYTASQLIEGTYCPTCAVEAQETARSGKEAVLALTKGDTFQLSETDSGIVPLLMVKQNGQWKLLNEVYKQYFNYNSATGKVTVINVPNQSVLSIEALVTLQSKKTLNGDTGIIATQSQTWTIELFNASFSVRRNQYTFAYTHVTSAGASLDLPKFNFTGLENYVKLDYSCPNADVVVDGGKLWLKGRNALGTGTYKITVSAVATNPIEHVVETQQINVVVMPNLNYDHMILDTTSDQFSYMFENYGSYINYDETEQAYRYQTATPSTQTVSLVYGNRFTEKCKNGTWTYPYFVMDVKFNYDNGKKVGDNCYDNTLAFTTFDGNTLWFTGKGEREQVRIYNAGDPMARAISYAEVTPNVWYTIAIPMDKYGLVEKHSAFTLFYGASENDDNGATDMYFRNIRFADQLGGEVVNETETAIVGGNVVTDFINNNGSATVYKAGEGYQFKGTTTGERSSFDGTLLSNMRTNLSSNTYVKIDVKLEQKGNLVFTQGVLGAETYYALSGGFTIDGTPVKQADIYKKGELYGDGVRRLSYRELTTDVWYTVLIPIQYPTSVTKDNYVFGVMTYATGVSSANCTAWLNNLRLANHTNVTLIGDTGTDFDMFTRFVSNNQSFVKYQNYGGAIGKAYKLNANAYIGFTDVAKQCLGNTTYARMTMEFRLEDFNKTDTNVLFFNKTDAVIGIAEMFENGKLSVDDVARVLDAYGNRVNLADVKADVWYTIEIINPVIDWAFLGSINTDVYFRNMVWYASAPNISNNTTGPDVWGDDFEIWE